MNNCRPARYALLFLLPFTVNCSTYYTKSERGTTSILTFGRALPDAVDEVLAKCHDPLLVAPSPPVALKGDCVAADLSAEAYTLWLPLAAQSPIDFSGAFSATFADKLEEVYVIENVYRNCTVTLDIDMMLEGVKFDRAEAKWITHNGSPTLAVDFEQAVDPNPLAVGTIKSTQDCENPLDEIALDILPEGDNSIVLSDIDFDMRFKFRFSGTEVTVAAQSDFTYDMLDLSPPFHPAVAAVVGPFEEVITNLTGITHEQIARGVNDGVELALSNSTIPEHLERLLEDSIPAGDQICSLDVFAGRLRMTTARKCVLIPLARVP